MKTKDKNFFIAIGTLYLILAIFLGLKLGFGLFLLACILLVGILCSQWLFLFAEDIDIPGIGKFDRRVVGTITLVSNTFAMINLFFGVIAVLLASGLSFLLVLIGFGLGGFVSKALISWDRQTLYLKHSVVRNRIIVGIITLQLVIFWIGTMVAREVDFGHHHDFGAAILLILVLVILLFIAVTCSFWVLVPIIFLIVQKVNPEEVFPLSDSPQDQTMKRLDKIRPLPAQDRIALSRGKDPKAR